MKKRKNWYLFLILIFLIVFSAAAEAQYSFLSGTLDVYVMAAGPWQFGSDVLDILITEPGPWEFGSDIINIFLNITVVPPLAVNMTILSPEITSAFEDRTDRYVVGDAGQNSLLGLVFAGRTFINTSISTVSAPSPPPVPAGWWNDSFAKRQPINISSASNLTDHQVFLNVSYDADMQADFDDLRFTYPGFDWTQTSQADFDAGVKTNVSTTEVVDSVVLDIDYKVFDDFSDGDYTNNPTWTADSDANWDASNFYLKYTGPDAQWHHISTPSTATKNWEFSTLDVTGPDASNRYYAAFFIMSSTNDPSTTSGYWFRVFSPYVNVVDFVRMDNGTAAGVTTISTTITAGADYDWKITRDSNGTFTFYKNGVEIGSATDNTYSTSNYVMAYYWKVGTGRAYYDNIKAYDGYFSTGTLASQVKDLGAGNENTAWAQLDWNASEPADTDIAHVWVRAGDSAFLKNDTSPSWTLVGTSPASPIDLTAYNTTGRYFQWRFNLTTTNISKTPTLHDVTASALETQIPHWIEDKTDSSYAEAWVKVPRILADWTQTTQADFDAGVKTDVSTVEVIDSVTLFNPSDYDDFEDTNFTDWDTKSGSNSGTLERSTDQTPHHGSYIAKFSGTVNTNVRIRTFTAEQYTISFWYYDTGYTTADISGVYNRAGDAQWLLIGVLPSQSADYYVYNDGAWQVTSVARTTDWHEFKMVANGTTVESYIDGTSVGNYTANGTLDAAGMYVDDIATYFDWYRRWLTADGLYASTGTLASQVKDLGAGNENTTWAQLDWNSTEPADTDIAQVWVRADDTAFLKNDTSPSWTSIGTSPASPVDLTSYNITGRYFQWKFNLTTTNTSVSPTLHDVTAKPLNRIYMYYGNTNADSTQNGTATFYAFMDKDYTSGWTISGTINVSSVGEFLRIYNPSGTGLSYIQRTDWTTPERWSFEMRFKNIDTGSKDGLRIEIIDGGMYNSFTHMDAPRYNNQDGVLVYDGGTRTLADGKWVEGTEYIIVQQVDESDSSSGVNYYIYNTTPAYRSLVDSALGMGFPYSPTDADGILLIGDVGGDASDVDAYIRWAFLRKYADPEPTVYFGAEESRPEEGPPPPPAAEATALSLWQSVEGSKAYLAFTRGITPFTIERRISYVKDGTFEDWPYPNFGFALDEMLYLTVALDYTDTAIQILGQERIRAGFHNLLIKNNGTVDDRVGVIVRRE